MMKLLSSVVLFGVVAVSSSPSSLRGPTSVAPDVVTTLYAPTTAAPEGAAPTVYEAPRVTMLYSSMNKDISDLMAKQIYPLLESPCGHAVKWDFVPYGKTFRYPFPWANKEFIYQAEHGYLDFIQNIQQLCTIDTYNNTAAGWEKTTCLQSMASQHEKDKRGKEWFESGENMKNCFGVKEISEFKAVLDCASLIPNPRVSSLLENAAFKTEMLGADKEQLPKIMVDYKPVPFTEAFTDIRSTICKVNKHSVCCDQDAEAAAIDKKYWEATQIWSNWAQEAVREAADGVLTHFDIRAVPASILAKLPQEVQDGLVKENAEDRYITDADLAKARGLDVSQTQ